MHSHDNLIAVELRPQCVVWADEGLNRLSGGGRWKALAIEAERSSVGQRDTQTHTERKKYVPSSSAAAWQLHRTRLNVIASMNP